MGEITRSVFRSLPLLVVTFWFAGKSLASPGLSPGGPLIIPDAAICRTLFQPIITSDFASPTSPLLSYSGTWNRDSVSPKPREQKAAKIEIAPSLVMAGSAQVFDLQTVNAKLSSGKKLHDEIRPFYESMAERGPDRYLVLPTTSAVLDPLYESMPNFKPALDMVRDAIELSIASQEPIRLSHMILLGDPGLGKTRFAKKLAQILGTGFEFVSMNNITAGWVLSGAHFTWKGASMGTIAKVLVEKDFANPIFVVDEIDKSAKSEGVRALTSLHQLWEMDTARSFKDEFLDVELDASHINWIATANDLAGIPKTIQDRAEIIRIPNPTKEEMRAIIPSIMIDVLSERPKLEFDPTIPEDVFQILHNYTPRQVARLLKRSLGSAVRDKRRYITVRDINLDALKDSEENDKKRGMGFLAEF